MRFNKLEKIPIKFMSLSKFSDKNASRIVFLDISSKKKLRFF